ncbi:MAG: hypothetical protein ACXVXO_00675 [Mycobacteriaceae bacterium]
MSTLAREAREQIKVARMYVDGVTIAGYVRHCFPDGVWHGDRCGCPDDRCVGHHHDAGEECGCLDVELGRYACGLRGHTWGEVREYDYGHGVVRWVNCTQCTDSKIIQ